MDYLALFDAFKGVFSDFHSLGAIAGLGSLLTLLIRTLRNDAVQNLLPKPLKWENLPQWAKLALPFALSGAAALLSALAAGTPPLAAAATALTAALASIGFHHADKSAAKAVVVSQNPPKAEDLPKFDLKA